MFIWFYYPQITEKSPQFFDAWKAKNPKISLLIDLLQLNHVYTSVWFLVLVSLVAVSLAWFVFVAVLISVSEYEDKVLKKNREKRLQELAPKMEDWRKSTGSMLHR
ncbi:MAG: cytochrome c biogenesis protein ResB [Syntrophales bacterium]|nr:cytochrome c biogenesis protein ResB [Syntrophales bacterium]